MATVLDRPPEATPAPAPTAATDDTSGTATSEWWATIGVAQWILAALLAGAGAVHFAMAPAHFAESTVMGVGFLVAGWLQLALAAAVLLRPSRRIAIATIVVSAACVAAWIVSRTVGIPFGGHGGQAEPVTTVDGLCVAMELAAIVAAGALLARAARGDASAGRHRNAAFFAFNGVVAVLLLTSIAIATPEAHDHSGAAGGHDHDATTPAAGAATAPASDTGAAVHDHDHGLATTAGAPTDLNGHAIDGVKAQDVAAEHQPDVSLDPDTRTLMSQQLVIARQTAMRYPTVADAEAGGYRLVAGFGPGSGAHYIGGPLTGPGPFDPTHTQSLIYAGTNPSSPIVGLMYFGLGETAPEGFAGPNDHWHRHSSVCTSIVDGKLDVPFPPDHDVTEAQCTAVGGRYMQTTGWMVHAWVVPGWESPSGVYSHENPNLRCADGTYNTDAVGKCQGI